MLATVRAPMSGNSGRVAGVAYRMPMVQVPPAASGEEVVQVCEVIEKRLPMLMERVSAVIASGPPPLFVTVTTLVTAARGEGMVKVSVRTPRTVPRVPLVAAVKVRVPTGVPVPVSVTGEPVTVAPVKATASVLLKAVDVVDVEAAGANTTL